VHRTDDWPYGDHVPFLNDYIEPRAIKHLVTSPEDSRRLAELLAEPKAADLATTARRGRGAGIRRHKQLLTTAGRAWGPTRSPGYSDSPRRDGRRRPAEFLDALSTSSSGGTADGWRSCSSRARPLHPAWMYEGRVLVATLFGGSSCAASRARRDSRTSGDRFGYIMTVGEPVRGCSSSGLDVSSIDDVQDTQRFNELKQKLQAGLPLGRGQRFLTIEDGSEDDIEGQRLPRLERSARRLYPLAWTISGMLRRPLAKGALLYDA